MDKASWANNLLNDPMFIEVMESLKSAQLNRFLTSKPSDIGDREDAYLRITVLDSILDYLDSMAADKLIEKKRFKIF